MDESNDDADIKLIEPGPKRKSKFWAYFKAYDLEHHPDKSHTARCSLCGKDISVKQGTGGLLRHLQHIHAKDSEELNTIAAAYPSRASEAANSPAGVDEGGKKNAKPPTPKKPRLSVPVANVEVVEAKIKREEHNLKMWRDAREELKRLKQELKEAEDDEDVQELEADILGFKNRKASFARLLGFD
ncbi:hypothetical protein HJC23_009812 [Cyclotella cryptica]|uniref:BED-type domain-containing protein n=1 Tax=Cyclotella cryptica TaxID=29204 RepID=A0ABD3PK86_9STRA|eukprot:CCRYP_014229-RA/>CCRYP_014229-RA protein AED:0.05 eAED:0.08 QI:0/-1/0/1/-1/1/1/0/185